MKGASVSPHTTGGYLLVAVIMLGGLLTVIALLLPPPLLSDLCRQVHGATLHHWRWRGLLTDYLAAPASGPGAYDPSRPAILLCHGFGAFSEHHRDNVAALAAAGYHVYAPTLPGYGRAEKPVLPYGQVRPLRALATAAGHCHLPQQPAPASFAAAPPSAPIFLPVPASLAASLPCLLQDLWRDFLADFVLQVARRPVVVAGNSIGGFISASMAADYPGLVDGLILINSAGQIVEGYRPPEAPPASSAPPAFVVDGVSRVSRWSASVGVPGACLACGSAAAVAVLLHLWQPDAAQCQWPPSLCPGLTLSHSPAPPAILLLAGRPCLPSWRATLPASCAGSTQCAPSGLTSG
jgi:pimeloyl-ACP methyl ester carboxylesterase